jgi:hypothetical protein
VLLPLIASALELRASLIAQQFEGLVYILQTTPRAIGTALSDSIAIGE